MTPISANYLVQGERETGFPQQETAMNQLSGAVRREGTRTFPNHLWFETGYYNTRLRTASKGIIVPLANFDPNAIAERFFPKRVDGLKLRAIDYANFGQVRVEFDPEEMVIKVISADANSTFKLDLGIKDEKIPDNPEIAKAVALSIFSLMALDKRAHPAIYRSLRSQGLVLIHVPENPADLIIKGFILSGRTLKKLGLSGFKDDVLYSFGLDFINPPFQKGKIGPDQIKRFHPEVILAYNHPQLFQGHPKIG